MVLLLDLNLSDSIRFLNTKRHDSIQQAFQGFKLFIWCFKCSMHRGFLTVSGHWQSQVFFSGRVNAAGKGQDAVWKRLCVTEQNSREETKMHPNSWRKGKASFQYLIVGASKWRHEKESIKVPLRIKIGTLYEMWKNMQGREKEVSMNFCEGKESTIKRKVQKLVSCDVSAGYIAFQHFCLLSKCN